MKSVISDAGVKQKDMTPLLVRLPPHLHAELKEKAESEERSMAQAVRYAIKRYLDA